MGKRRCVTCGAFSHRTVCEKCAEDLRRLRGLIHHNGPSLNIGSKEKISDDNPIDWSKFQWPTTLHPIVLWVIARMPLAGRLAARSHYQAHPPKLALGPGRAGGMFDLEGCFRESLALTHGSSSQSTQPLRFQKSPTEIPLSE